MSDNRKYYYLKLKENYFDDDSIVLLESMQDGVLYSNILLKLYLKSLKHGGRLQLDEDIPYTAQMIATITRQQIGTVERALQIFLKLGLVEVLDSGTFYMSNIELLIGQSSTEAERNLLPFPVISAAANGDTNAMCAILKHYEGYIAKLCTRTLKDDAGNTYSYVDEEMRNRLQVRLRRYLCIISQTPLPRFNSLTWL